MRAAAEPVAAELPVSNKADNELAMELKRVETAREALPRDAKYDGTRKDLDDQKEDLRRQILRSRPLGARLDSCRAAVERAKKRRDQAEQAAALAIRVKKEADSELEKYENDLK